MIARVSAIAKGGAGLVRDEGRVVFVPGVVAGETVEYEVAGRRRSAWLGRLLRVLEPSPQRVPPPCRHYGECGGCNLQHMSVREQLRCKAAILDENLRRLGGRQWEQAVPVLPSPAAGYRAKVEFQVRGGRAGFFARDTRRLVEVAGCLLLPSAVEGHLRARRGSAAAVAAGSWQVVSNGRDLASLLEQAGGRRRWLSPGREVRFTAGAHSWLAAPGQFVQANLFQMAPMLELLEAVLERERPQAAADLFCGGGFFTLPLAARCRQVTAVENDPANVAALHANLERSAAGNVRVVCGDALRLGLPVADLFVVDPPRGGLSPGLIRGLAAASAAAIVYYSCDSATFARDVRSFAGLGWRLQELRLLDNFPHTDHFEIFSVLKRTGLRDT